MPTDKPRLARLTALLTQLQSGKLVTARSMAERHDVSLRTIYRDIRTLEQSGVPIYTEEGKGYSLVDNYRLPPVMFTESEANALLTAGAIIAKNKDASLVKAYSSAITKIRSVLPQHAKERGELLTSRLHTRDNPGNKLNSNYLIRIQSSITNHKLLRISYSNYKGNASERILEPFAVYTANGNWLLVAFCRLRKGFRAFRLDRITSLKQLDTSFSPHQISLEDYFEACRKEFLPTLDIPLSQVSYTFAMSPNKTTMEKLSVAPFKLIGITVRTSNVNPEKTAQDIGGLWQRLLAEQLVAQIPNKVDTTVYSAYTDFESDHTGAYTTVLGCKVHSLADIPEGMEGFTCAGGAYQKFVCRGDLSKGAVYGAWADIWQRDLKRTYSLDFEVYGPKALNPADAEVDIFVAVEG